MPPSQPFYESTTLLDQYLLFHYGSSEDILPWESAPHSALGFPVRCVEALLDRTGSSHSGRALDLGCAVGRSSYVLAQHCGSCLGIDYSHSFIAAAEVIRREGKLAYRRLEEGSLSTGLTAHRPEGVDPEKISFRQGDAMALDRDAHPFSVVLMANLIDRLPDPWHCLSQAHTWIQADGQLLITSPYTWLEEFTAVAKWPPPVNGARGPTLLKLHELLDSHFVLEKRIDLPFLIREHRRKFQWSVAEGTRWRRQT